jgi:hypothetical protein
MNKPPEKLGRSMDTSYPFGIIGDVLMNTIGVTLAVYFLYLFGTVFGYMAGDGSLDFAGVFENLGVLTLLVIPYVLVMGAVHISVAVCAFIVLVLWYVCLYSESLKQRLILLGSIFLIAFANAWYIST